MRGSRAVGHEETMRRDLVAETKAGRLELKLGDGRYDQVKLIEPGDCWRQEK